MSETLTSSPWCGSKGHVFLYAGSNGPTRGYSCMCGAVKYPATETRITQAAIHTADGAFETARDKALEGDIGGALAAMADGLSSVLVLLIESEKKDHSTDHNHGGEV